MPHPPVSTTNQDQKLSCEIASFSNVRPDDVSPVILAHIPRGSAIHHSHFQVPTPLARNTTVNAYLCLTNHNGISTPPLLYEPTHSAPSIRSQAFHRAQHSNVGLAFLSSPTPRHGVAKFTVWLRPAAPHLTRWLGAANGDHWKKILASVNPAAVEHKLLP
jgi:hypothetical protein